MTDICLAPWLVEESHKYYLAACLLKDEGNLLCVAQINAALSLEILLKNFLVRAVENEGTVYEKYIYEKPKGTDAHNLYSLYEQLPSEVKKSNFDEELVGWLKKYGDTLKNSRYRYEPNSNKSINSVLIGAVAELLPKVVRLYRNKNCRDPWILHYPNV